MPPKKASAPRPKVGGQQAAVDRKERARQHQVVTVGDTGVTFRYNLAALPIRIRSYVRDQTGKSCEELLGLGVGRVQVDSYCDLWWISRLAAGEIVQATEAHPVPHLISRAEVQAEWDDKCIGVVLDDIDEATESDPEANGQSS